MNHLDSTLYLLTNSLLCDIVDSGATGFYYPVSKLTKRYACHERDLAQVIEYLERSRMIINGPSCAIATQRGQRFVEHARKRGLS
jgi:hypothetical protein